MRAKEKDETKIEALINALQQDHRSAAISSAERALLDYAAKLAREPWSASSADIAALRAAGWSDAAILDLNMVAAYFAFVNRIAMGLGVELEPRWGEQTKKATP